LSGVIKRVKTFMPELPQQYSGEDYSYKKGKNQNRKPSWCFAPDFRPPGTHLEPGAYWVVYGFLMAVVIHVWQLLARILTE
jgi:hypothetical protein